MASVFSIRVSTIKEEIDKAEESKMPLLDKRNGRATHRSVIRHAFYGAIGGVGLFALSAYAKPLFAEMWYVTLPALVIIGAGVAAIMEWQWEC